MLDAAAHKKANNRPGFSWPYLITLISYIMTREEAIAAATKYKLQAEVIYEMDHNGCTPEVALSEWDIL
jgi:hypothetical protein